MIEIVTTEIFDSWLDELADATARHMIAGRVQRLAFGLVGDVRSVGRGVRELRIHHGPGYRIYFAKRGSALVILLCGGSKRTQKKDIEQARQLASELHR